MKPYKVNNIRGLWCLLALIFALTQLQIQGQTKRTSGASSHSARLHRLENQYEQLRRLLRIPGMSAAIVKDEKVIWSKGFGYADVDRRIPATPRTLYYIASLTKTFATTALMQLVERGELDLDDPMSRYSNEFKDDSVKVKHVLSHTANAPPGDRFRYDGARFALLTAVIEKKTGKSFRDLMTEMFLDPLQMYDSVPSQDIVKVAAQNAALYSNDKLDRYRRSLNRFAKPYRLYGDEIIHTSYPWEGISTSAGLLSTAPDLAKFAIAIDRHVYLKLETQARSWTAFISNSGRPLPHGLGWFVQDYQGVKCVWHFGNDPFEFSGTLVMVPEKRWALILLANSDALSSVFLRGGILHTSAFVTSFLRLFIFEEKFKVSLTDPHWRSDKKAFESELADLSKIANGYSYEGEKKGYAAIHAWLSDNQKHALKAVQVDPRTFDAYVGEYQLPDTNVLIVSRDGDRLMIQQRGESKIEIFSESSTRFFTKAVDAEFMFVKGADGKITHLELYQDGTVILKKIK